MTRKPAPALPQAVYANRKGVKEGLTATFGDTLSARKARVVVVTDNAKRSESGFDFDGVEEIKRLLILFEGQPIDLVAMNSWRKWGMENHPKLWDLRMAFVQKAEGFEQIIKEVKTICADWFLPQLERESDGLQIRQWVTMPAGATRKDDPSLLTMMFGSMGKLLTGIELAARRFRTAVGKRSEGPERDAYLKQIDALLAEGDPTKSKAPGSPAPSEVVTPDLGLGNVTDQIPKLLLLGKTGVGKTLIAGYLRERCGLKHDDDHLHVSIPEWLGKEDMFEYALFGYAAGAYTGGKPQGSRGLLLENVCRVVFLDEIGEASPVIQSKLLTFLDHFSVRPRGWLKKPFYCPVLVVAATNRPLNEIVDGAPRFRRDLLARFTDVLEIPMLRERKQDFHFILDCLLQRESMNPARFVTQIGAEALEFLRGKEFKDGNFRELEDLFREACKCAHRDDRPYLVRSDVEQTPRTL